jgi:hypothetical protein
MHGSSVPDPVDPDRVLAGAAVAVACSAVGLVCGAGEVVDGVEVQADKIKQVIRTGIKMRRLMGCILKLLLYYDK